MLKDPVSPKTVPLVLMSPLAEMYPKEPVASSASMPPWNEPVPL